MLMKTKLFALVVILITTTLLLAACGGSAPAAATIPAPPNSQADTGNFESTRKSMEDAEKASLTGMTVEMKAYATTATMDELVTFYNDNLKGWTGSGASETNGVQNAKWTAPSQTEAVVIFLLPAVEGVEGNPLFVEHAWK
jgi:hypothetical protein